MLRGARCLAIGQLRRGARCRGIRRAMPHNSARDAARLARLAMRFGARLRTVWSAMQHDSARDAARLARVATRLGAQCRAIRRAMPPVWRASRCELVANVNPFNADVLVKLAVASCQNTAEENCDSNTSRIQMLEKMFSCASQLANLNPLNSTFLFWS